MYMCTCGCTLVILQVYQGWTMLILMLISGSVERVRFSDFLSPPLFFMCHLDVGCLVCAHDKIRKYLFWCMSIEHVKCIVHKVYSIEYRYTIDIKYCTVWYEMTSHWFIHSFIRYWFASSDFSCETGHHFEICYYHNIIQVWYCQWWCWYSWTIIWFFLSHTQYSLLCVSCFFSLSRCLSLLDAPHCPSTIHSPVIFFSLLALS